MLRAVGIPIIYLYDIMCLGLLFSDKSVCCGGRGSVDFKQIKKSSK